MKLYHSCGEPLLFEHTITMTLHSYFTYRNNLINLFKHILQRTNGINPNIFVDDKTKFYCPRCRENVVLKETRVLCDECRSLIKLHDTEMIGESFVLCKPCTKVEKQFLEFFIFDSNKKVISEPDDETPRPRIIRETPISYSDIEPLSEFEEINNDGDEESNNEGDENV